MPVFCLGFLQLSAFFLYDGFLLDIRESTKLLILFSYLGLIGPLIIFSLIDKSKAGDVSVLGGKKSKYFMFFIFVLVVVFVIFPTIKLFGLGLSLGVDYVRANIFK